MSPVSPSELRQVHSEEQIKICPGIHIGGAGLSMMVVQGGEETSLSTPHRTA